MIQVVAGRIFGDVQSTSRIAAGYLRGAKAIRVPFLQKEKDAVLLSHRVYCR